MGDKTAEAAKAYIDEMMKRAAMWGKEKEGDQCDPWMRKLVAAYRELSTYKHMSLSQRFEATPDFVKSIDPLPFGYLVQLVAHMLDNGGFALHFAAAAREAEAALANEAAASAASATTSSAAVPAAVTTPSPAAAQQQTPAATASASLPSASKTTASSSKKHQSTPTTSKTKTDTPQSTAMMNWLSKTSSTKSQMKTGATPANKREEAGTSRRSSSDDDDICIVDDEPAQPAADGKENDEEEKKATEDEKKSADAKETKSTARLSVLDFYFAESTTDEDEGQPEIADRAEAAKDDEQPEGAGASSADEETKEDGPEAAKDDEADDEDDDMEVNKHKRKKRKGDDLTIDMEVEMLEDDTEEGEGKLTRSARKNLFGGSDTRQGRRSDTIVSPARKRRAYIASEEDSTEEDKEAGGANSDDEMGSDDEQGVIPFGDLSLEEKKDGDTSPRKRRSGWKKGNDLSIDMNVDYTVETGKGGKRKTRGNEETLSKILITSMCENIDSDAAAGPSKSPRKQQLLSTPSRNKAKQSSRSPRTQLDREQAAARVAAENKRMVEPAPHHGRGDYVRWTCGGLNCTLSFATHRQVYEHMLHDHPEADIVAKCLDCGKFGDFPELIVHRQKDKATCSSPHLTLAYWTYGETREEDMDEEERNGRRNFSELAELLHRCISDGCPLHGLPDIFETYEQLEEHNKKAHNYRIYYICRDPGCRTTNLNALEYLKHERVCKTQTIPNFKIRKLDKEREKREAEERKKANGENVDVEHAAMEE